MTIREAFVAASGRLAAAEHPTDTPDLDARVLLGHATGLTHASLLSRWPEELDPAHARRFEVAVDRRLVGEPVAWITGFKEFLGMDFKVVPGLLVPRADTETLVEAALEVVSGPRVVDVCTGTGCVAVGLAALSPKPLEVWAGDLSPLAVDTAQHNAHRLLPKERSVTVVLSDLLAELPGPWDLIVSNPPYLTPAETRERTQEGGWKEPALALDGGGDDGLNLIRLLVAQASSSLTPGGWLLLEAADVQMEAIFDLFNDAGLTEFRFWKDLAGQRRVAGARKGVEFEAG
jgi:release factor glutamine methyltransferase